MSNTFISQKQLAQYCRTGVYEPIQGANPERATHYRRLVYGVITDALTSCYPLTHALLTSTEWNHLTHRFFSTHQSRNPYLWRMPEALIVYVQEQELDLIKKYPFLIDLLRMEWLETEVYMQEDTPPLCDYTTDGNIEKDALVFNLETALLHCHYPVYEKKATTIVSADSGDYFLVANRHPETGNVFFTTLSPLFVRVVEILLEEVLSLPQLIQRIEQEIKLPLSQEIQSSLLSFLSHAQTNTLLLGFEQNNN